MLPKLDAQAMQTLIHRTTCFSQIRASNALKSSLEKDLMRLCLKNNREACWNFIPTAKPQMPMQERSRGHFASLKIISAFRLISLTLVDTKPASAAIC